MAKKTSKPRAVLVLGMHRSGTSILARGVNLLGAWLGEPGDLLPPGPDNPTGFFERADVMDLNDRVLRALGRHWHTASPLVPGWFERPDMAPFEAEIRGLVQKAFRDRALFAVKDPRLCLLLPLWRRALAGLKISPAVVLAVRNPLDVAASLTRRDGFSSLKSMNLWQAHNRAALFNARGLPLVGVDFGSYVNDPAGELSRVAGLPGLSSEDAERAGAGLAGFLDPERAGTPRTRQDLVLSGPPPGVLELHDHLAAICRGRDSGALRPEILADGKEPW